MKGDLEKSYFFRCLSVQASRHFGGKGWDDNFFESPVYSRDRIPGSILYQQALQICLTNTDIPHIKLTAAGYHGKSKQFLLDFAANPARKITAFLAPVFNLDCRLLNLVDEKCSRFLIVELPAECEELLGRLDCYPTIYKCLELCVPKDVPVEADQVPLSALAQRIGLEASAKSLRLKDCHILISVVSELMKAISKLESPIAKDLGCRLMERLVTVAQQVGSIGELNIESYDRLTYLYEQAHHLVYSMLAAAKPYSHADFQSKISQRIEAQYCRHRHLMQQHFLMPSCMATMVESIFVAACCHSNGIQVAVEQTVRDISGFQIYFELDHLLSTLHAEDLPHTFVIGMTTESSGRTHDFAPLKRRMTASLHRYDHVSLVIDRTLDFNNVYSQLFDELSDLIAEGRVIVYLCNNMHKYCILGTEKIRAGNLTIINNGADKFAYVQEMLAGYGDSSFAKYDEYQYLCCMLDISSLYEHVYTNIVAANASAMEALSLFASSQSRTEPVWERSHLTLISRRFDVDQHEPFFPFTDTFSYPFTTCVGVSEKIVLESGEKIIPEKRIVRIAPGVEPMQVLVEKVKRFFAAVGCTNKDDGKSRVAAETVPEGIVEKMRNSLNECGLRAKIQKASSPLPAVWISELCLEEYPLLRSKGKGATREESLASAYGEMFELLSHDVFWQTRPIGGKSDQFFYEPQEIWLEIPEQGIWPDGVLTPDLRQVYEQMGVRDGKLLEDLNGYGEGRKMCAIPFRNSESGIDVFFPMNIVNCLYQANGLGAGATPGEARQHALYEILERHVRRKVVSEAIALPVIDTAFSSDELNRCRRILEDRGFYLTAYDASFGGRYPVACLALRSGLNGGVFISFAAGQNVETCMNRAFREILEQHNLSDLTTLPLPVDDHAAVRHWRNLHNHYELSTESLISSRFFTATPEARACSWDIEPGCHTLENIFQSEGYDIFLSEKAHLGVHTCRVLVPGFSEVLGIENLLRYVNCIPISRAAPDVFAYLAGRPYDRAKVFAALEQSNVDDGESLGYSLGLFPDESVLTTERTFGDLRRLFATGRQPRFGKEIDMQDRCLKAQAMLRDIKQRSKQVEQSLI